MPAPASTTWPVRKRAAAPNGTTASSASRPRRWRRRWPRCFRLFSRWSARSTSAASSRPIPARRRWRAPGCGRRIACEIEPQAFAALRQNLRGDVRIKTLEIDGWTALSAYVPPPERRGLVLVDPPFEEDNDFHRLSHGLGLAHRKWASGIYALWYPIKGRGEPDALAKRLRRLGIGKILRAELTVMPVSDPTRLNGAGLILVNPPWTLQNEL